MKIGATIANKNIILQIIKWIAPYVYNPCPIASICKKLVKEVSANPEGEVLNTLKIEISPEGEEVSEFNKNTFKLFINLYIQKTFLSLSILFF